MVKDKDFSYEVLLGDPESIRGELKTTDKDQKPRSQSSSPDPASPRK
jgi:hypothetical protein